MTHWAQEAPHLLMTHTIITKLLLCHLLPCHWPASMVSNCYCCVESSFGCQGNSNQVWVSLGCQSTGFNHHCSEPSQNRGTRVHTICTGIMWGLWSSLEHHEACLLALSFVYGQHGAQNVTNMFKLCDITPKSRFLDAFLGKHLKFWGEETPPTTCQTFYVPKHCTHHPPQYGPLALTKTNSPRHAWWGPNRIRSEGTEDAALEEQR